MFKIEDEAQYASVIAIEFEGVRQYVQLTATTLVGVAASDGKLLWRFYTVPSPKAGRVLQIHGTEGEMVKVHQLLVSLEVEDERLVERISGSSQLVDKVLASLPKGSRMAKGLVLSVAAGANQVYGPSLTISAAFGILVLIFQDGRLEGLLGYTSQGALEATQPLLLFAIGFGLEFEASGIGPSMLQSSTLTITQTASRDSFGSTSLGRSTIAS